MRVLQLLVERELTVSELVEATGALQGRLSSHLACLRWCGFVAARREGRQVYYSLADDRIPRLLSLAAEFLTEHADSVDLCRVIDAPRRGDGQGISYKEGRTRCQPVSGGTTSRD